MAKKSFLCNKVIRISISIYLILNSKETWKIYDKYVRVNIFINKDTSEVGIGGESKGHY